jgi:hypothetical protein
MWRQWGFPREYRIPANLCLPNGIVRAEDAKAPDSGEDAKAPMLDVGFAAVLCNEIHRVGNNVQQLRMDGHDMRELSRIERSMQEVREFVTSLGVQALDLKGEPWDEGRGDFEPLAPPDPVPGLTRVEIIQCERPAVVIDGKLVQRARGILGKPE